MGTQIVILGASFGGLTAALELRRRLGESHDITVVARSDDFLFQPSLIWVPFGLRKREDVVFPLRPIFERRGIGFVQGDIQQIDLAKKRVHTSAGELAYDYLVLATGVRPDYARVPGLGPRHFTQSIFGWDDAEHALVAFERFLLEPGPVVVGACAGNVFLPAAYEFALNLAHQLQRRGPQAWQHVTFVTPEPYLGHLGLGSVGAASEMVQTLFHRSQIDAVTEAQVTEVRADHVVLADGRELPFRYAMLAPPLVGIDPVRRLTDIVDDDGLVQVDPTYRTLPHPEVFAVGSAISIPPAEQTALPCGFPKSGYLAEETARIAAQNIAALVLGGELVARRPALIDAKWVLDAGDGGIVMSADHQLEPRAHTTLLPGPHAHWTKLAFEKYFLATRSRGFLL